MACRDPELFVGPIDESFLCPISSGVLPFQRGLAVTTPCGHTYCLHCISESLKRKSECPTDRQPLCQDQLVQIPVLVSTILRNLVAKCDCVEQGCSWEGPWENLESHLKSCDLVVVGCKFHEFGGCRFRGSKIAVDEHEKDCEFKMVACVRKELAEAAFESKIKALEKENSQLTAELASTKTQLAQFIEKSQLDMKALRQELQALSKAGPAGGKASDSDHTIQEMLQWIEDEPHNFLPLNDISQLLRPGQRVDLPDGQRMNKKQLLLEAIRLNPDSSATYRNLAVAISSDETVQLHNGRLMTKLQLYMESIRCNPNNGHPYLGIGRLLYEGETVTLLDGRQMDKRQLCLASLGCGNADPHAHHALGKCLAEGESVDLPDGTTWTKAQLLAKS